MEQYDYGQTPMMDLFQCAEVVVIDMMPTTVFSQCLLIDKPVIVILPNPGDFTPLARKYYDEFVRVEMFHESAESAANFINKTSIRSWWQKVKENAVLNGYMRTFCNTDPGDDMTADGTREWMRSC